MPRGQAYQGKGERKGTPGHYSYVYRQARKYTAAKDAQREEFSSQARSRGIAPGGRGPDYTDLIATPSAWMTGTQVEDFAIRAENSGFFDAETVGQWREDPDSAVSDMNDWEFEVLSEYFDRFFEAETAPERAQIAVEQAFGDEAHAREARRTEESAQTDLFGEAISQKAPVYYASGSNSPAQIRGLANIGAAEIGVAAPNVAASAEKALIELAGQVNPETGELVRVFVDSGAFSEVSFPDGVPTVTKPVTPAEWDKRLSLYERLADALGEQLVVVAPDQVGFQAETLRRMRTHADRMQGIAATGASVMVPLQGGRMRLAEFEGRAREALGLDAIVPALPMKKGATSTAEIMAYVRDTQPERLHLLGMGEKNPRVFDIERLVRRLSPDTVVSLDSSLVRANVGRQKAKGKRKKKTDVAQTELFKAARGQAYRGKGKRTGTPGHYTYDYDEPRQGSFASILQEARPAPSKPAPPQKDDPWFDVYGPRGAPRPGEKGYKEDPTRPPGAHDGQEPYDLVLDMLDQASQVWSDEDWAQIYQGEHPDFEYSELPDLIGVPARDGNGELYSENARSHIAERMIELARETREEWAEGGDLDIPLPETAQSRKSTETKPLWSIEPYRDGLHFPKWVIAAALADSMDRDNLEMRLALVSKDEARAFVEEHHSALPYLNPKGLMYAIGVKRGGRLVAVATAGTPTGNWSKTGRDPHQIVELTRVASDGTAKGAASKLVSRLIDLMPQSGRSDPNKPALLVTYQLESESGTTYTALRDKGLRPVASVRGSAPSGARAGASTQSLAHVDKIVWEAGPEARPAKWGLLESTDQTELFKAARGQAYRGKGKRTGTPGHYTYDYEQGSFAGILGAATEAKPKHQRRRKAKRDQEEQAVFDFTKPPELTQLPEPAPPAPDPQLPSTYAQLLELYRDFRATGLTPAKVKAAAREANISPRQWLTNKVRAAEQRKAEQVGEAGEYDLNRILDMPAPQADADTLAPYTVAMPKAEEEYENIVHKRWAGEAWTDPAWAPDLTVYDQIVISSSGGKDSQAMLDRMVELVDAQGVSREKIVVTHADLGRAEWDGTKELARKQAHRYGVRFHVVWREAGDLLDAVLERYDKLTQKQLDQAAIQLSGVRTWEQLLALDAEALAGLTAHVEEIEVTETGQSAARQVGDTLTRAKKMLTNVRTYKIKAQRVAEKRAKEADDKLEALEIDLWNEQNFPDSRKPLSESPKRQMRIEKKIIKAQATAETLREEAEAAKLIDFGEVVPWFSSATRYCTSDHKRTQLNKALTVIQKRHKVFDSEAFGYRTKPKILNCQGLRAQESASRAEKPAFARNAKAKARHEDVWYPIQSWSEEKVWDRIRASGTPYAESYDLGMSRLSCVFCMMASTWDLRTAAYNNPELLEEYIEVEAKTGKNFKPDLSMADLKQWLKSPANIAELKAYLRERQGSKLYLPGSDDAGGLVQISEPLAKALERYLERLFRRSIAEIEEREGVAVEKIVIDYKATGACLHFNTPLKSIHVTYFPYPHAYGAAIEIFAIANKIGLLVEEHGAPNES